VVVVHDVAMAVPQIGIFALGTASQAYLEFDLLDGIQPAMAIARVASLREPRTTIGGVNLVVGIRPELWAMVAPEVTPSGVTGFGEDLVGPGGTVLPATQHDLVLWLTGATYDVVFDASHGIRAALGDVARLADEVVGWSYHHDRDLTGFIDGSENPTIVEATSVAVIPDGRPGAGASILLLQRWAHDIETWEALPVGAQESVIGRTKADGVELDPRPPTSHVARTDQETFGKILRRNIAYGTLSDHGTIFVGFSADQAILARMLESMIGLDGGPTDQLTRYANARTGAYYVVPASDDLAALDDERVGAPS
jgi:putative iron-dependent peroxidase